ncbi:MAG: hypothetical protein EOR47_33450 [Mesorhizobium sp.]|uniref:hypothetical protein n=1 Tax=Mesorhizobium sp. TaxID=1871066 RepID=UPI000FE67FE3|nr:hypothetical protein [Mesorhizobium sp.]RWK44909.1 MAG: hypothetical protein EOR47_33450 [Mesorhizobium sp.]
MARKPFISIGEEEFTKSRFRRLSRAAKVELMVTWFQEHFEDPAEKTPYESAEGGYQWIWGGPYNADEEIQDTFSEVVDFDTMQKAVEEIEKDGLYDWAPTDIGNDAPYEEDDGIYSINDPLPDIIPPEDVEDDDALTVEQLRQEMLQRLDRLEDLIRAGQRDRGMIGHNNPPSPIDDLPVTRGDLDEIQRAIGELRHQAQAPEPAIEAVHASSTVLRRVAGTIGGWLVDRVNAAVDAGIQGLIPGAVGAVVVAYAGQLYELLQGAAAAAMHWVQALPLPF